MVVAHVEAALRIGNRDQATELDAATAVDRPNASAVLAVMKTSLHITGAVGRVGGTDEQTVVEAERRRNGITERLLWRWIGLGKGESDGGIAPHAAKLEPLFRLFDTGVVAGGNPPHRHVRLGRLFKPLQTIAEWNDVPTLVYKLFQRLNRCPNRHIDVDAGIGARQYRSLVPVCSLQSTDKSAAAARKSI